MPFRRKPDRVSRTLRERRFAPLAAPVGHQVARPPTRPPADREEYEQQVGIARAALGESAFLAAFWEGGAMTLDEAIGHALQESDG